MPVIKANVIASPSRKFRKQGGDGSQSDGEGVIEMRRTPKKDDIGVDFMRTLRGELREMGKSLRQNIKKDIEGVLKDCGGFQMSPRGPENFGHTSQVRCPSRGMQDIYVPPRCASAPAHSKRSGEHSEFAHSDQSNVSFLKPGMHTKSGGSSHHDDLQVDLLDHSPGKGEKNTSNSPPMAWQPSTSSPKPPVTMAAHLPGEMDSESYQDFCTKSENSQPGVSEFVERKSGEIALHRSNTVHRRQFDDQSAAFIEQSLIADQELSPIQRMVSHDYFDYVMGGLILTNSVVIGVQTHMLAVEKGAAPKPGTIDAWQVVDMAFSTIFLLELILRMAAFKAAFFFMESWSWNVFDTVCVLFSVVDELTEVLLAGTEAKKTIDNLSILRVLRLFRLLRLVRMVRFIPALKSMVYLISASLQSFFWTMVLILGVMFIVAVYLTEVSTDLAIQGKSFPDDDIQQYWGNLFLSISTLFQAITGGDDWHNFVLAFKKADRDKYFQNLIFFILYISFASLVLMNLVTGVFVEGAQRIAAEEKKQDLQKQVRKIVRGGRVDINAHITWDEFTEQLATKDMGVYLRAFQMDRSQAADIFYILDDERAGTITMKDFFSACMQLHGTVKLSDTEILRHRMMHSIGDLNERIDALERRQERILMARAKMQENNGVVIAKEPLSGVPDERAQSPIPFPFPPNISGYLLKTGNNKHMVRWVL